MSYTLDEILWEFTLKCNKNCKYCGSKNILNTNKKSKYTQEEIANYITKVNPKSVTITGGEPSCEFEQLEKCIKILYDANIEVKILTNGNLFSKINLSNNINQYIKQYGLSINEDIDIIQANNNNYAKYSEKTTIITNFGTHNLKDFEKIAKYAMQFSCWQVQLTMGNEFQLDFNDIKTLQNKLLKLQVVDLCQIIKADNFNCYECTAGKNSFSITYDGNIIPCLSYRSWKSDLNIQGEVKDIENIWKNGFKFNRNREFIPCCKDITGIKHLQNITTNQNKTEKEQPVFVYGITYPNEPTFPSIPPITIVYGVSSPIQSITELDALLKDKNNKNNEK